MADGAQGRPPLANVKPLWGMEDVERRDVPTGAPMLEWMSPTELLVNASYQRDLSEKSINLIRRIVENWDWRRFKPPVVAWTENGFEIIDGQHTAFAAATRGGIAKIPVLVVEAADVADRANAFIGHNQDRLKVTAMQLHHAAVAAGDEDALTVRQVCERAGVRLLSCVWGREAYKVGDTNAIAAIQSLVKRRHAMGARKVLEVLVAAECAPVTANQIKAADFLMSTAEYAEQFDPVDLTAAIRTLGDSVEDDAKTYAHANNVSIWKGLAVLWFKRVRKRRAAAA